MAASAVEIARLRRMVNEPSTVTYTDALISAAIERFPLTDAQGVDPLEWDYSTTPPTSSTNDNWIATYDLNQAAGEIWEEKAAALAPNYTFSADGATYNRQQVFEQYMQMASIYRSRGAIRAIGMVRREYAKTEEGLRVEVSSGAPIEDQDDHN